MNLPFEHLRRGDINTIGLATATHSEEDIEAREAKALVARGDGVEGRGVIENIVVEGKFATGHKGISISYLG